MIANQPEWEGAEGAARVFGNTGPWTWYVAEAWQQAAAPELFIASNRRPSGRPDSSGQAEHASRIAYWSPLLELTTFGLGWRHPELGLWTWNQLGRPTDDPLLRTLAERFGHDIEVMTAWLLESGGASLRHKVFHDDGLAPYAAPAELKRRCSAVREQPDYQLHFSGGSDPHHLIPHLVEWKAQSEPQAVKVAALLAGEQIDYLLIGDDYHSLFRALHRGAVPSITSGRSTRVSLICPSIGWLGTYRKSRVTNLWFRGAHRWHTLGTVNGAVSK